MPWWFFTDRSSPKADEVREGFHVSVGYADISSYRYAACAGQRLRVDPALAHELWHLDQKGYVPDGPDVEHLAILEVSVVCAEYWLAPGRSAYYLAALRADPDWTQSDNPRREPRALNRAARAACVP